MDLNDSHMSSLMPEMAPRNPLNTNSNLLPAHSYIDSQPIELNNQIQNAANENNNASSLLPNLDNNNIQIIHENNNNTTTNNPNNTNVENPHASDEIYKEWFFDLIISVNMWHIMGIFFIFYLIIEFSFFYFLGAVTCYDLYDLGSVFWKMKKMRMYFIKKEMEFFFLF